MIPMIRSYLRRLLARLYDRIIVREQAGLHGQIDVAVHDVEDLELAARQRGLEWAELDRADRAELAREVAPIQEEHVENATLAEWHEHIVDLMDPDQTPTVETASHAAVGTDSTAPMSSDTGLGNEVFRSSLASTADRGRDFFGSLFLDTSEANGNRLVEFALCSNGTAGSGIEYNHATFSDVVKNDKKTVTIDCTIEVRDS